MRGTVHQRDDEIATLYKQGVRAAEIARQLGLYPATVSHFLHKSGLRSGDGRKTFSDEKRQEIIERYQSGELVTSIAEDHGVARSRISQIAREAGIPLHKPHHTWTDEEVNEIVHRWQAGESTHQIAPDFACHNGTIVNVLRRAGVYVFQRTNAGEKHGLWKGGRIKNQGGYILVRLPPDHPMVGMCVTTGYVLEHRLVMAEKLGRPLSSRESVHHINGDREDNHPDNLELRRRFHGQGSSYICLDCGSHNIGPEPLA
jgi:uncharacterized protein (DUF433 family)